jgi:hypothetical protein
MIRRLTKAGKKECNPGINPNCTLFIGNGHETSPNRFEATPFFGLCYKNI